MVEEPSRISADWVPVLQHGWIQEGSCWSVKGSKACLKLRCRVQTQQQQNKWNCFIYNKLFMFAVSQIPQTGMKWDVVVGHTKLKYDRLYKHKSAHKLSLWGRVDNDFEQQKVVKRMKKSTTHQALTSSIQLKVTHKSNTVGTSLSSRHQLSISSNRPCPLRQATRKFSFSGIIVLGQRVTEPFLGCLEV